MRTAQQFMDPHILLEAYRQRARRCVEARTRSGHDLVYFGKESPVSSVGRASDF